MAEKILTEEEFDRLLELSRLSLTDEEKQRFFQQITEILSYCKRIESLNLPDRVDYFFPNQGERPLRDDTVQPGLSQEQALVNAPERVGEFFVVPRVVRHDAAD
ncbi:MAG: Asp-tRNA(Asn)/Glu-tRNA(Gln) amidotransferase subunit GatC [bacterium]